MSLYKIKLVTYTCIEYLFRYTHTKKMVRIVASGRMGGGQTGVGKRHVLLFEYFKIPSI